MTQFELLEAEIYIMVDVAFVLCTKIETFIRNRYDLKHCKKDFDLIKADYYWFGN